MLIGDLLDDLPNHDVVSLPLRALLNTELDVYQDRERAERLLLAAHESMPDELEIVVALYKLYAYFNRGDEAIALVDSVLRTAAQRCGYSGADDDAMHSAPPSPLQRDWRLYLYSLKAKAFISLRCGQFETAKQSLNRLARLDPDDEVGGSVVRTMFERLYDDA